MNKLLSTEINSPKLLGLLALFSSFLLLVLVYQTNVQKGGYKGNDIFYIWSDGHDIAHGVNPYSKIHGSDMLKNQKYSTYLPGFFLFVSAYVSLGYESFNEWLKFWRPLSFFVHFSIGAYLYFFLLPRGGFWLALFGAQFWLLSRWSVGIMNSGQIDAVAMVFLLLSLALLEKKRATALIIFGISLSVKQISVFMLPIVLLLGSDLNRSFVSNLRQLSRDLLLVAIVPFLLCLPFLIWDYKGLLLSLIFSATRSPGGHIKVPSIDELLGYVGLLAKIPMLGLLIPIYFLVLQKKIGPYLSALSVFLVFVSFNSVLFKQYMPWFCVFLGLALSESKLQSLKSTPYEKVN